MHFLSWRQRIVTLLLGVSCTTLLGACGSAVPDETSASSAEASTSAVKSSGVQLSGDGADCADVPGGPYSLAYMETAAKESQPDKPIEQIHEGMLQLGEYVTTTFGYEACITQPHAAAADAALWQCLPPPADLVSWWSGDNTANDLQGGNHGLLQNGASYAAGMVGQAFSLDGVNDFVEIPDSPALDITDVITVSAWIKTPGTGDQLVGLAGIVGKMHGVEPRAGYVLAVDIAGKARCDMAGAGPSQAVAVSTTSVTDDLWHHVACSYDGTTVRVYVDGQLEDTVEYADGIGLNDEQLRIGFDPVPLETARFFNGLIDEAAIFHRALAAEEIAAIYTAGSSGQCKPAGPITKVIEAGPYVNFTVTSTGTEINIQFDVNPAVELHELPFRYRLDEQPSTDWTADPSHTFSGLTPGGHLVVVQVRDVSGDFEPQGVFAGDGAIRQVEFGMSIAPESIALYEGQTQQFTPTCFYIVGQSQYTISCGTLAWSLQEPKGTLTNTGHYTSASSFPLSAALEPGDLQAAQASLQTADQGIQGLLTSIQTIQQQVQAIQGQIQQAQQTLQNPDAELQTAVGQIDEAQANYATLQQQQGSAALTALGLTQSGIQQAVGAVRELDNFVTVTAAATNLGLSGNALVVLKAGWPPPDALILSIVPQTVEVGQTVTLNGAGVAMGLDPITAYMWYRMNYLGAWVPITPWLTSPSCTLTPPGVVWPMPNSKNTCEVSQDFFPILGPHRIRLRVKDAGGLISGYSEEKTLTVIPVQDYCGKTKTEWKYLGVNVIDTPDTSDPNCTSCYTGTSDKDIIVGSSKDDTIDGKGGDDCIYGLDGSDTIHGGGGNDEIHAGEGHHDELHGGWGVDYIYGDKVEQATIYGNDGDDYLYGATGYAFNHIYGGWGSDHIWGGSHADTIEGNDGDDYIYGQGGGDTISGGWGSDQIWGGLGTDAIYGNDNHDFIWGDDGDGSAGDWDYIDGGWDMDTLMGNGGGDVIYGGSGVDHIFGQSGDDEIHGGNNDWSGYEDESLYGNDGNDTLYGEWGRDLIYGGAGASDYCNGGADPVGVDDICDSACETKTSECD